MKDIHLKYKKTFDRVGRVSFVQLQDLPPLLQLVTGLDEAPIDSSFDDEAEEQARLEEAETLNRMDPYDAEQYRRFLYNASH